MDLNAGTARNDEKRERNHRQGEHCSLSRDVVTIYFSNIIGVGAVRVIPILEIVSDDSLRWHYACLNFPLNCMSNTEMSNFTFLTSLLVSQNQQLWDLGLSRSDMENEANVDAKIAELSAQFDFVILAEFFDEGLVILARLLCWELEDVNHKTYKKN